MADRDPPPPRSSTGGPRETSAPASPTIDHRAVFARTPGMLMVLRVDGDRYTIADVNDDFLRFTGRPHDDLVGRDLFDAFPDNPDDPHATGERNLRASLARCLATREPDTMPIQRYDIRVADGRFEERFWRPVNAPLIDAAGRVTHIVQRTDDITDLVRLSRGDARQVDPERSGIEEELYRRASALDEANRLLRVANQRLEERGELLFRALFDSMPQLGWTALPDGNIDHYNRGWYEYTGTTLAEMQGWGWRRVHDPELLPLVEQRWRRSLESGTPFEMEFPLRRHDGVFRWFLTRAYPIVDSDGRIVRWVGINTDIHDRRMRSAALEMRLRRLVESISDYAIVMLDSDGTITTWNPGVERYTGYRADEVIGRPFTIFYPPEDAASGKCEGELDVAAREGRFEEDGWRVRKDGTRYWANVVLTAVRDDDGRLVGFAKVMRDLTEQRRAEEERLRLGQAHEAIRLRDEFLSIASHELKTPLTSLLLQLDGLRRSGRITETFVLERLDRVRRGADRLAELIDALLDVSRIATGRLALARRRFDLAEAVREVCDRFGEQAKAAGCQLFVDAGAPIEGAWDRLRIEQVVTNLLANALKYGAHQPVSVRVDGNASEARLTVEDHGPGVAEADRARIFERFERASSARHYGGFGLGLFVTRQIVEGHGGRIEVEGAPGEGARFVVTLPREPPST